MREFLDPKRGRGATIRVKPEQAKFRGEKLSERKLTKEGGLLNVTQNRVRKRRVRKDIEKRQEEGLFAEITREKTGVQKKPGAINGVGIQRGHYRGIPDRTSEG